MEKSRDAFRTISEVADWLDVPTHVLRFWESRFSQIKPVKRAGGRRYYRPSDMRIIGGVKSLLHDQGMTIRGVQKLFREQGIKHISSFSPDLYDEVETSRDTATIDADALPVEPAPAARATRVAEPAPLPPEDTAVSPDDVDASGRVAGEPAADMVFVHRRPTHEPAHEFTAEAAGPKVDDRPASRKIPETPDVPATDPEDDDADHAGTTGLAAGLALAGKARLERHRPLLAEAARRLRDLFEQAS